MIWMAIAIVAIILITAWKVAKWGYPTANDTYNKFRKEERRKRR